MRYEPTHGKENIMMETSERVSRYGPIHVCINPGTNSEQILFNNP